MKKQPKPARKKAEAVRYGVMNLMPSGFVVWDWLEEKRVKTCRHEADASAYAEKLNAYDAKYLASLAPGQGPVKVRGGRIVK